MIRAAAVATGLALAFPACSGAVTTIGSDLTTPPTIPYDCSVNACSVSQNQLAAARAAKPAGLISPVNGNVVRWRISVGTTFTAPTSLQVVRPFGALGMTDVGTSAAVTPPLSAVTPYETQLPIAIGDSIGITYFGAIRGMSDSAAGGVPQMNLWNMPRLSGGAPRQPTQVVPFELLVNADIEPTSAFSVSKRKALKRGKLRLTITVPNAGTLKVNSARGKRGVLGASREAAGPVPISLTLKPNKRARSALRDRDLLKARIAITFTATGGAPATENIKVALKG